MYESEHVTGETPSVGHVLNDRACVSTHGRMYESGAAGPAAVYHCSAGSRSSGYAVDGESRIAVALELLPCCREQSIVELGSAATPGWVILAGFTLRFHTLRVHVYLTLRDACILRSSG
ncbi:hypothetical protein GCM10022222_57660 [Amycolatopsis ultiminotia]|uniref:Uncharacterized protein n=1 Tax=Amycolatopsis ultiminotia TaxID=543629 RepID=A0ABP6XH20_9PSEU